MGIWASPDKHGRVREGLIMLLSQGIIDDLQVSSEDERPFRVTIPVGIVPMTEEEAAYFSLGAVTATLGPIARARSDH